MAGSPPQGIERPSPPPCCADGQCFASPLTYGYYPTRVGGAGRWKVWLRLRHQKPRRRCPPRCKRKLSHLIGRRRSRKTAKHRRRACLRENKHPAWRTGVHSTHGQAPGAATAEGFQQPAGTVRREPAARDRLSADGTSHTPQTAPLAPPAGQGTQPSTQPLYKSVSPDSPLNRTPSARWATRIRRQRCRLGPQSVGPTPDPS